MKIKTYAIIALLVASTLVSCKTKNALDFSNNLVKLEQSLEKDIEETETKVSDYIESSQFDSVVAVSKRMEKKVDAKMQEAMALKAPDGKEGKVFKDAYMKMFQFLKDLYNSYAQYGSATDAVERVKKANEMATIAGKKQAIVDDVQSTQRAYASAYGFKLEK
jgi:hypothetical protein